MKAWCYVDGKWVEGNPPIMGPMAHAFWLSSMVFDGARAFEGVAPDLYLHCARVVRSAASMGLKATLSAEQICDLCWEGIDRHEHGAELYIRPMFYAEKGWIYPDPESTKFVLAVYESPLPDASGFSVMVSSRRRPSPDQAPTDAKAACLYPNAGRALRECEAAGFDNAITLDALGNVAELATANLFMAKDGAVHTPAPNGTFLNGITRQRVIQLLRSSGVTVNERAITPDEVRDADEIFSSGNYGKVQPVTRIEKRDLQPGPFYKRARELYWEFAHAKGGRP